jgi:hypothetical protein
MLHSVDAELAASRPHGRRFRCRSTYPIPSDSPRDFFVFRSDAFDVFNHPNFGNPSLNVLSSSFGVITSTRFPNGDFWSARQLQLGLKLIF